MGQTLTKPARQVDVSASSCCTLYLVAELATWAAVRALCVISLISSAAWAQALTPSPSMTGDDGCPEGFTALPGEACLALPTTSNERVIVYFHGMLTSPWATKSRWELGQLARAATPKGYAVLALRGLKGLCDWSDEARQNFCWPNGLRQQAQIQPIIDRLREALADASKRARIAFKPPCVVGFSNGGFLVSLIASDTRFAVTAYAIAHGGPVIGQGFPPWRRRPMLLVTANGDAAHFPRMKLLAQMLGEDRWDSTFTVREGVHEMTVDDMKAIVDFFDKV